MLRYCARLAAVAIAVIMIPALAPSASRAADEAKTSALAPFARYWWGNEANHDFANYGADECCDGAKNGKDQWVNTAQVGKFPANPFGLQDMHGNVSEWVDACFEGDYNGEHVEDGPVLPVFISLGGCAFQIFRGGAWSDPPDNIRSATREFTVADDSESSLGVRVARDLD